MKLIHAILFAVACTAVSGCVDTPYVEPGTGVVAFRQEGDPVPPNLPTPPELEVCILRAELCMHNICDTTAATSTVDQQACVSKYEDCAYDIPEAHVESCRTAYVWCVLGEAATNPEWVNDFCKEVVNTCGTNP